MKQLKKISSVILFLLLFISTSNAQLEYRKMDKTRIDQISMSSFIDYPPFAKTISHESLGVTVFDGYDGVFITVLEKILKELKYAPVYLDSKETQKNINDVRFGMVNSFIGLYYTDDINSGVEFVMPAVFTNPITVMMLPSNISKVKSVKDLQKLKGIVRTDEYLGDFVRDRLKQLDFDIEYVDNAFDAFNKIISQERDYLITSKYNGMAKALEFGIYDRVSFAKNAMWNLQMFFAFSKTSLRDSKKLKELKSSLELALRKIEKENTIITEIEKELRKVENKYRYHKGTIFSDVKKKTPLSKELKEKP